METEGWDLTQVHTVAADRDVLPESLRFSSGSTVPWSSWDKVCIALADTGSSLGSVLGLSSHPELPAEVVVFCVRFCLCQEVQQMRWDMFNRTAEGSVQMPDWALQTSGMDTGQQVSWRCACV